MNSYIRSLIGTSPEIQVNDDQIRLTDRLALPDSDKCSNSAVLLTEIQETKYRSSN